LLIALDIQNNLFQMLLATVRDFNGTNVDERIQLTSTSQFGSQLFTESTHKALSL